MPNMNIRSSEFAWHNADLKLLGRSVTGLRGWELNKEVEKEQLYGAGQHAIDITEGNVKCSGSLTVLGYELDAMNSAAQAAGYDDILAMPHEGVVLTVTYRKTTADPITKQVARGVAFTNMPQSMQQGAKNREIQLSFVCMDITGVTI